mmetsp:Transcript_77820/g.224991  ORF Transcript_77820/g.224991 Transcript_77820/m.224991 type:complete len:244 (-) Transcript_77820:716-1447(-)
MRSTRFHMQCPTVHTPHRYGSSRTKRPHGRPRSYTPNQMLKSIWRLDQERRICPAAAAATCGVEDASKIVPAPAVTGSTPYVSEAALRARRRSAQMAATIMPTDMIPHATAITGISAATTSSDCGARTRLATTRASAGKSAAPADTALPCNDICSSRARRTKCREPCQFTTAKSPICTLKYGFVMISKGTCCPCRRSISSLTSQTPSLVERSVAVADFGFRLQHQQPPQGLSVPPLYAYSKPS